MLSHVQYRLYLSMLYWLHYIYRCQQIWTRTKKSWQGLNTFDLSISKNSVCTYIVLNLFIKGPSLIYIQHLIFNFNICTEKEPSIVLIAIYVSVSQIQSVLSSSFFSPSQNCHPIIFLLNWKHLSDYFELHSKIESASKHFMHMYSGLMITQSGMDHYMDHSDLV